MDEACSGASWERIMRNMCQSAGAGENGPFRPHRSQPAKTPRRAPHPPTAHRRAPCNPPPRALRPPTIHRRASRHLLRPPAAHSATPQDLRSPPLCALRLSRPAPVRSAVYRRAFRGSSRSSQPAAAHPATFAARPVLSAAPTASSVARLSRSAPVRSANPLAHRLAFCEPATRTNVSRETSRKQSETTDRPPRDHRRHALERQ